MQRWRVPLGFACAALFFLLAQARPWTLVVGGLVALPGLGLRAWATGHLRKNDALATTGPYAYTRNPLYLGSFVIGLGFTIAAGRLIPGIVFAVLFLGIYVPVMRVEAKMLDELFGKDYQHYAAAVPMFLPRVTAYQAAAAAKFDPALYRRYREHRAAIGLVVAWLLLAIKWYWLR
jgi:protein-S-isoprenylcysteine O-methyltransferase Ste14